MAKKKGAPPSAAKRPANAPAQPHHKDELVDEAAADTVVQVIHRRIRAAKKKLLKIGAIEEALAEGKAINDDQARTIESRIQVNAILEELTRIGPLVERALKKEIDEAVAKTIAEAKAKEEEAELAEGGSKAGEDEEEDGDEGSSPESSSEPEKEDPVASGEEVGQLVDLLYVSQVFGLGGTSADYTAFLGEEMSHEDRLNTHKSLERLADLGKSLIMRQVEHGLTHQEALNRCRTLALAFVRNPTMSIDDDITVASMMEFVNHIKSSHFFTSMVIEPTPEHQPVPQTTPGKFEHESLQATVLQQADPSIHIPTQDGAHIQDDAVTNILHNQAQVVSTIGYPGINSDPVPMKAPASNGPRPFLPFPSLPSMPLTAPQAGPPIQEFPGQMGIPPHIGFGPVESMPGYMPVTDYRDMMIPHQVSTGEIRPVADIVVPEVTSTPLPNPLLDAFTQEPRQEQQEPNSSSAMNSTLPNSHNSNQYIETESRHRGPIRKPRGVESSGNQGPQGASQHQQGNVHGSGEHVPHSGGRGYPNRGGTWGGHRTRQDEGRGRGRGRSGQHHGSGWEGGGSYGGRGQNTNGFSSRGGNRGNRGGFRGDRGGGGAWNRPQNAASSQPTRN